MSVLRIADPFLQYSFLQSGYAARTLAAVGLQGMTVSSVFQPASALSRFSVAGLNETASLVLGLMTASSFRHVYWASVTRQYEMPLGGGLGVGVYNFLLSAVNSLLLVYTSSRHPVEALTLGWKQYLGGTLFAAGIALEVVPEAMRKTFKNKPGNRNKIINTGAWGVIRHPNYLGYALWRTGITLTTGHTTAALAVFASQLFFFKLSSQDLANTMQTRYGEKWEEYCRQVPYKLLPGIW